MKKAIAPRPYETPSIRPIMLAENDVITTSDWTELDPQTNLYGSQDHIPQSDEIC